MSASTIFEKMSQAVWSGSRGVRQGGKESSVVKAFMSELLLWATRTQPYHPLPIRLWRPQFRIVPTVPSCYYPPTTIVLLLLSADFHASNQKKPSDRKRDTETDR